MKKLTVMFLLLASFSIAVGIGQGCSPSQVRFYLDSTNELSKAGNNGNGQSYDGKITFIEVQSGFKCENISAPKSILRKTSETHWTLVENETDKCVANTEIVNDILYDTNQTHIVFRGRDFYRDETASWDDIALKGHVVMYSSSADVDPNSPDANLGDGICADQFGKCSVQAAFEEAAAHPKNSYVISLAPGVYKLNNPLYASGKAPIELVGENPATTILDGQGLGPILAGIGGSTNNTLRIEKLGFTNGYNAGGGALTVINSVHIKDCRFSGNASNSALRAGVYSKNVLIEDSVFENNLGSAIQMFAPSDFTIRRSRISNNGDIGVHIQNGSNNVKIIDSSIFNNKIGVSFRKCYVGCGIYNSTIAKNSLYGLSVSLDLAVEDFIVQHTTIVENGSLGGANLYLSEKEQESGFVRFQNSIVGKAGSSINCIKSVSVLITPIAFEGSLVDDNSCEDVGWPQQTANLDLSPFQNLGLDHWGYIPNLLSPAVDAGVPSLCLPLDQRGQIRTQGPNCDMGATER